jgi:uncharacterized protein (DUF2267 family)
MKQGASRVDVFEVTLRKTNEWLGEIMAELGWDDRHKAYIALRACLQTLRDRLTLEEAVHPGAELPMLVRGFYYEGWHNPSAKPLKMHRAEFLGCIRKQFRVDPRVDPEAVTRVVFKTIARRVSTGEMRDVQHLLPKDLRELWPDGQR